MKKFKYDTEKYAFKEVVQEYLGVQNLEGLHHANRFDKKLTDHKGESPDQRTKLHRTFYRSMDTDPSFKKLYDSFIESFVRSLLAEKNFLYQTFPTLRIHQPKNIAVFAFHKDKDYNHSSKEINFFLPMTRAFKTNTFWAESSEDKGDFSPIESEYGGLIMWNGANLKHGNKTNETDITRVSFDFRIIYEDDYLGQEVLSSKSRGKKFCEGEYFTNFKKHKF